MILMEQRAAICEASLDLFVRLLGSAIGSAALLLMPTGGVDLGVGIPPRILSRLQQPDFLSARLRRDGKALCYSAWRSM